MEGEDVVWADGAAREQGGTPNFIGAVAVAEACRVLEGLGFDKIAKHEAALVQYAAEILPKLPRVKVHRSFDAGVDSLPIFPFSVQGFRSALVGAYLGIERGIGVRTGYLCQYAHVNHLLGLSEDNRQAVLKAVAGGDMRFADGIVRASAGIASTISHLRKLGESLRQLVQNGPRACYSEDTDGTIKVKDWPPVPPGDFT